MIAEGFALIDGYNVEENPLVVVPTAFGKAGELDGLQEDWVQGDSISAQHEQAASRRDARTRQPS